MDDDDHNGGGGNYDDDDEEAVVVVMVTHTLSYSLTLHALNYIYTHIVVYLFKNE